MKKGISVVLAGVLLLGLLVGASLSALADSSFATVAPEALNLSISHIDWSLTTIDGRTVTKSTYADKTVLLVFYRATMSGGRGSCGNSNSLIQGLANSDWIGAEDVQVIAVDVDDNTAAVVRAYKETYAPDCSDIVFTYGNSGYLSYYLRQAYGASGSYTLAFCAIVKNDTLCYAWDGAFSAMVCQSALAQVSSVPGLDDALEEQLDPILAGGSYQQAAARSMLTQVNALRTGDDAWYWNETDTAKITLHGLRELTYDYALEQIAMRRAAELALSYSHTRPNGSSWAELLYEGVTSKGENIAYGYRTVQSVFDGWAEENDPYDGQGHRRNMLSAGYTAIGIACFYYDGVYYWAQEFGWTNSGISEPDPDLATPSGNLPDGLKWRIEDGTLIISGSGAIQGFGYFSIAPWAMNAFTSVRVEDGVTSIGDYAFHGCVNLTSVEIPDSVTAIGMYAFADSGLTSVEIPDSVTAIGNSAFAGSSLTSIEIPASVETMGYYVFSGCVSLTDIYCLAPRMPSGWHSQWSGSSGAAVHWVNADPDDADPSDGSSSTAPDGSDGGWDWFPGDWDWFPGDWNWPEDDWEWPEDDWSWLPGQVWAVDDGWFWLDENGTLWFSEDGVTWFSGGDAFWNDETPGDPARLGDLNGNGEIDATDYMLLKRAVLGTYVLDGEQLTAADVNGDGEVSAVDYMLVKRAVLGTYLLG